MAMTLRNLRKRWKKQLIMLLLIAMVAASFSNLVAPLEAEAASPANLVASYDFNGNFSDSLGNSQLSVVSGTYGGKTYSNSTSAFGTDLSVTDSTYWRWTSNAQNGGGFTIDLDPNISDHYSIGLRFSFDSIPGGYAKIIDYKNKTSDDGFYFNNGKLNFYPTSTGNLTTAANQVVDIIATRDRTTQKFIAYMVVNGVLAKQIETVGSNSVPVIVNGKVRFGFFHDDYATAGEKTTGGKVYSIKFWDGPITQEQAQGAMNTPAPALSATATAGTAPGTTKLTATPGAGHTLAVRVSDAAIAVPNIGEAAPTGTGVINPYASGADISSVDATTNKYVGIYEIDALGKIVAFKMITLTAGEISPAGAASAPGGVTGKPVVWLKAEDAVPAANGSALTGWTNQAGENKFQVDGALAGKPNYQAAGVNFNPVVAFNGNARLLGDKSVTMAEAYTVTAWNGAKDAARGAVVAPVDLSPLGNGRYFFDSVGVLYAGNGDGGYLQASPPENGEYAVWTASFPSILRKNGINAGSGTTGATMTDIPQIGSRKADATNNNYLKGNIAEVIVLNSAATADERSRIESYLALKYGLTLNNGKSDYVASNGSKMWSAADNAGFDQRITGIGKDSASGLEQKQSKSQENGALVTIAAGNEIKASNEAYPEGTIQNDLSFLTFSDNGGDTAYNTAVGSSNLQRMARAFKVDKTNWKDGNVTLQLDGTQTDKLTYVVIGGDSGFTGTLKVAQLTEGKVTLNSSDLADGSYFTFAQVVAVSKAPGGVSGASLWLKGDKDATANGAGQLTGWTDQTGTNRFEVKGAPAYKSEAANFNPAVSFDNTTKPNQNPNQYLIGDKQITYKDGYVVFKQTDGTAVGSAAPRPGGYGVGIFSKWGKLYIGNGATGTYRGFSFNDASRYYLAAFDAAASIESQGRLNGTPQTVAGDNSFSQIDFTPVIGGTFGGGNPNNWSHFKGELAEVVLYPASHTVQEKQQIESYLALKYGLTLNGGKTDYTTSKGSKFWTADNNQGYGNRITGIGRDDGSDLYQKQSKSQVQGALVTIALGDSVQASNAANTNTIDADSSFFVFSDNGATAKYETNVPEAPGHTLKQLNRMFKVEKSNWQDRNITLKLDVAAENPSVLYYLIIDGVNSGIKLDAAGQATFDSSKLGNGSLFTFAKVYKNVLQSKLTGIKGLTEASYTPESWTALQTALTDAEAVLNNPGSTQEQVDAVLAALETARANLSSVADKLKTKMDEVQNEITIGTLKPGDYTTDSWGVLTRALDDAKALLNRTPQATPVELGQALSALELARGTLVDLSKLRAKEAEIVGEQLNPARYTPTSWQELQQALSEAQAVLSDPDATQAEVDAAKTALEKARTALVPVADKSKLQEKKDAINGEGLTESEFTPESWAALKNALVRAETVLSDPDATQQEVDTALAVLISARNNLVKARASLDVLDAVYKVGDGNPVPIALYPQFDGKLYLNYEAVVPNAVDKISINPKTFDPNGTVSVTLNGQPVNAADWSNLPLKEGLNVIKVETTGPDGSKNVYTIEVMRVTGKLVSLTPSEGSMVPAFNPDEKTYNLSVSKNVYALQWTPVALDPQAVIEISINGGPFAKVTSGTASEALPLQGGVNTIVVKVTDRDGGITQYTITVTRKSSSSSSGGNSGGGSGGGTGTSSPTDIISSVNDKDADFAAGTVDNSGDRTRTNVVIDADKLAELIDQGTGQKFVIRVPNDGDIETKGLTAELVRRLTESGSSLEIGNLLAIYPIPGKQLNLSDIAKKLNDAALGDIEVQVEIKRASASLNEIAKDKASTQGYELLVSPVDLKLSFSSRGQTAQANRLSGYAAKYIALPEGIDPNRITTGVYVNPDGTVFHLPTVVTKIDNRYFARINDLRSSGTYSVIWNPQDLDDVKNHWAREDVNDVVARLILEGTGNNTFTPDRNVIRSEFAAITATGMGLMRQNIDGNTFGDVPPSSWYHDAVAVASEFGIVLGYEDGLFHGDRQITREQGIAMISRAYDLIETKSSKSEAEIEKILSSYSDAANVSGWAKEAVARMIAAGIVEGREGQMLRPQESMTRAEASALIRRLLKSTNLID
ncbi:S-layer homology domain-containing protein [Paenibacillus hamazuiensis]|uniref:S-layer homology domain-containing protein n=1 Tax=Paenibacillus hamazuiensis TaxID=2936508 RepID=UPI0020104ACC|nr:S-layer homology domain-containing protein [Paenibacillus hamazuiensis]